jgi:hypothetical protein
MAERSSVMEQTCEHCHKLIDLVVADDSVSVPDANGNTVVLHKRCVEAWILKQSGEPSAFADGL